MLLQYEPGKSFFHKLDVRAKAIWLAVVTTLLFIFSHPLYLGVILVITVIIGIAIRLPFKKLSALTVPLLIPFAFMLIYETFFHHNEPAFFLFTVEGFYRGLTFVFRLLTMVVASTIFTMTTSLSDLSILLKKMHVPAGFIFILTTGFTMFPTFQKEAETIFDAQKSRGRELEKGMNLLGKIRVFIPIFVPLLMSALRRSEVLTRAMLSRAYGASKEATALYEIKMKPFDYVFVSLNGFVLVTGIFASLRGYGVMKMWI